MSTPLQAKQFHGTREPLNPGDMVEPGHPSRWSASKRDHVYFTSDPKVAAGFARRLGPGEDESASTPRVYEVEPTGPHTNDRDYEGPARKSRAPLRVIGEHKITFDFTR